MGRSSDSMRLPTHKLVLPLLILIGIGASTKLFAAAAGVNTAQTPEASATQSAHATSGHAEHGLPQQAVEIGRVFGLPITNSMIVTWIVAAGLIIFAQMATRHMKRIPEGAQNFWEWLVDGLSKFLEGVIGQHLVQKTF